MRPRNDSILRLGCTYTTLLRKRGPTANTSILVVTWVSEAIVADVFMSAIETITSKKRQLGDISAMFGVGIRRGTTLYRSCINKIYIKWNFQQHNKGSFLSSLFRVYSWCLYEGDLWWWNLAPSTDSGRQLSLWGLRGKSYLQWRKMGS